MGRSAPAPVVRAVLAGELFSERDPFCRDDQETALKVEQDVLNSFRKNGFELISPRFNHMRNFLVNLPFMAGAAAFKQLRESGVLQRAGFNVANLMPVVADSPLATSGLTDLPQPAGVYRPVQPRHG